MKKLTALALCLVLLTGCTSVFSETAGSQEGVYTIYNLTGEKVLYVSLTDNVNGVVMKLDFDEGGLDNGGSVIMTRSIPQGEDGEHRLTLTFETESGYQGVFPTLSIETVPISLLAEDTVSGATAISFSAPENKGKEKLGVISMNGMFSLECTLPDGYKIESTGADAGSHFSVISSEVEGKPAMYLSIVFNELLADVQRLNDLSAEDLAKIEETFREDDRVEISYTETKHGTKLMVVKETDDGVDYVDFYTIYKGYEIEFVLLKTPFGEEPGFLNDTDIQMAVDFLSDLDFVAAE
ncbi:MAG: hypothetical protein K6A68_14960 [Clostridiales bacterium]|nr:hypothetical protein [Clostridiales bacterium]